MSNTAIRLKKSGVTGNTPASLEYGEVAINYADGKLWYKNTGGGTSYISNQKTFDTIVSNGSLILATSTQDTLSFVAGDNITIETNTSSKTITINALAYTGGDTWVRPHANAAFEKANSAGAFANGAFVQANTATANGDAAYVTANAAFDRANAAYTQANNTTDTWGRTQSNSAFDTANAAYTRANNSVNANTGGTITGDIDITGNLTVTGANTTLTNVYSNGQVVLTNSGSTDTGAGQLYLNGSSLNRIDWNNNGTATPSFTTTSTGTKLTLYPSLSGSSVDYGIGIEPGALWTSIPQNSGSFYVKWYGGETEIGSLDGVGNLILSGNIDANDLFSNEIYANSYFYADGASITDRANSAYLHANAAYTQANTPSTVANAAYIQANSAFDSSNIVSVFANGAFVQANNAYDTANSAGVFANGAFVQANSAYEAQNTTSMYTNSAFAHANAAYAKANTGTTALDVNADIVAFTIAFS